MSDSDKVNMPWTVGRLTSLHFAVSLRPTVPAPCTFAQIPNIATRAEFCSRWSKGAFDVRPLFDGGRFDSLEHRASCYEHNKDEQSGRNTNRKGRDYRRMQQILLSAHHEPSWTPSVLICSHQTGLNLDPHTCPPATHSTSERCYSTHFFLSTYLQSCTVLCSHGVTLLLLLKQLPLSVECTLQFKCKPEPDTLIQTILCCAELPDWVEMQPLAPATAVWPSVWSHLWAWNRNLKPR